MCEGRWSGVCRLINRAGLVLGLALVMVYVLVAWSRGAEPYDYAYLMAGAERFCFDNANFVYGWPWLYPAPFYTTFCVMHQLVPGLLLAVWLLMPLLLALWLAEWRAAVLLYPPLFLLILLGQSTWLVLPVYMLAAHYADHDDVPVRWWHGLIIALSIFKPHIALLAGLYLLWRWRHSPRPLITGALASSMLMLPAFLMRPGWLLEWLPNSRGYEPHSLASLAILPVRWLGLGVDRAQALAPGPAAHLLVWGFCLLVGALLAYGLWRRRGGLELYDWVLIFALINPTLNDYDLVILLPFITSRPRRLLLGLTAGVLVWLYALVTASIDGSYGLYHASLLITLSLLGSRLMQTGRSMDRAGHIVKWWKIC